MVCSIPPVFVFVLLSAFVNCLAQPECLGLDGFFTVVMMLPALAHSIFKCLSGFAMHTQAWCPDNVMGKYAACVDLNVLELLGFSLF